MQEKQPAQLSFVQTRLPWIVAGVMLLVYLLTLNKWVSLSSLPLAAQIAGWDTLPPAQNPLFYILTYPLRWFPGHLAPIGLNIFAAICSALTLAVLTRSVALLPHDRTHEQRLRERSEYSLLSIPSAWLPPLFAALVCGLQLTFWENAVVGSNEALDLLIFAYCVRCLLEYRIEKNDSWLVRMAFVYGCGITNNWALIGFLPLFILATIWIKGISFFQFQFLTRMLGGALIGLSLYLLLPLIWSFSGLTEASFWEILKTQLGAQKGYLLEAPALRSRALVLSLTSILPVVIIGFRWPSSFGDTSAAGNAVTSLMFRVVHIALLAACLWVAFDPKYSPRSLGFGLPFLTFYYLGALSIGYFTGYLLLISGEAKSKARRRRNQLDMLLGHVGRLAVWAAFVGVPVALAYKNFPIVRANDGRLLSQFVERSAKELPASGALVLSDEPTSLLLLEAYLHRTSASSPHILVHTRSLSQLSYHSQLGKRYPNRWPAIDTNQAFGQLVNDSTILALVAGISRSNAVYYMHPSFGYYFEYFYPRAAGLVYELNLFPTNTVFAPPLSDADVAKNDAFWKEFGDTPSKLASLSKHGVKEATYLRGYYSRALNNWGVIQQKKNKFEEAGTAFKSAAFLNTNNVAALANMEFNSVLQTGGARTNTFSKAVEEKFGALYRSWEPLLMDNGPFDQPEFCHGLGKLFLSRNLLRQAAGELHRAVELNPDNTGARMDLVNLYLVAGIPKMALQEVEEIRKTSAASKPDVETELVRLEAAAEYSAGDFSKGEQLLWAAHTKFPREPSILDSLVQMYNDKKMTDKAFEVNSKLLTLAPDNPLALLNQATILNARRDYTLALQEVDKVLQKAPKHAQALLFKTSLQVQLKDFNGAEVTIKKIFEEAPDQIDALLYKSVIDIEEKSYDEAIDSLNRVLKKDPANWNALMNRALAYLRKNDLARAEVDYENLRKLLPDFHVPHYGLGEIAYQRKDRAKAISSYEQYLRLLPQVDSPEMQQERKVVSDRLNELKAAQ